MSLSGWLLFMIAVGLSDTPGELRYKAGVVGFYRTETQCQRAALQIRINEDIGDWQTIEHKCMFVKGAQGT